MQYDVKTPEEYLSSLDDDWRKQTLEEIRQIILAEGTEMREIIQYKMLGYQLQDRLVFSLNAQKNYVSLYVGDHRKIDPKQELLEGLNVGKGCIRFSKTNKVEKTGIALFIERTIKMARSGQDIDC